MSTTKREPIVSDERIADRVDEYVLPYRREITRVVKEFRDEYESARAKSEAASAKSEAASAKNAELIQRLLNDMQDFVDKVDRGEAKSKRSYAAFKHSIEIAAAAGFRPSSE